MSKRVTLPDVYYVHKYKDGEVNVELSPMLANYGCTLQYDERGNANVTIKRKSDNLVVLDMSLDNGEVNALELD